MQIASDRFEAVVLETPEAPSSIRRAVRALARVPDRLANVLSGWTLAVIALLAVIAIAGLTYGSGVARDSALLASCRDRFVGHPARFTMNHYQTTTRVLAAELQDGQVLLQIDLGGALVWVPAESCSFLVP